MTNSATSVDLERHRDESTLPDWGALTHHERMAECPKPSGQAVSLEQLIRQHVGIRSALRRSLEPRAYWTVDQRCVDAWFDRDEALAALREATESDEEVGQAREEFDAADEAFDIALVAFYAGQTWEDRVRMGENVGESIAPLGASAANDNEPLVVKTRPKWPGILSSADFVRSFSPPDYAIDGVVQTGFLYSVTASTGTGKTAILLLISALAALGQPLGSREVKKGRVLYFAGENPDDVGMRWIGAAHHMGFDPAAMDVYFVPGTFDIASLIAEVDSAVAAIGGVDLVIIDTSAAYFNGTDENSNVDMGKHARNLRALTTLPGSPCVLVACHPTKSADQSNLLPRGGGAFLAEVDGNLVCMRTENGSVKLHWQGKHRGPDFAPVMFDLTTVTAPQLKDSRGRDVPTVLALVVPEGEVTRRQAESRRDEDEVLLLLELEPKLSQSRIAEELDWRDGNGKPHKRRAQTALESLRRHKLLDLDRSGYKLTAKGFEAATELRGERHSQDVGAGSAAAMSGRKSPWRSRTEAAPLLSDDDA